MPLLSRKATLLAKIETVSGTDAVPTGAANSIQVRNLEVNPVVGDFIPLNFLRPYFGNSGKVPGALYSRFAFECAIQSSGAAGTPPKWGPLLRMCACAETTLASAHTGTATAGATGSITLAAGASAADNAYRHMVIRTTGGTGSGQKRTIKSYVGATKVATVTESFSPAPDATTTYSIDAQVAYNPISSAVESATLYFNVDGVLHKILNAYGSVEFMMDSNGIPVMKFSGLGVYVAVTDVAAPTTDYSGWKDPLSVNHANSATLMRLHGFSTGMVLQRWTCNLSNQIVFQSFVGRENPLITDRAPSGQINLEAVTVATKDWFTSIRSGTLGAFAFQQGTVAGSIVDFHAPQVQLTDPSYNDVNGQMMLQAGMEFRPFEDVGGNNEFVIVAR